MHVTWRAIVGMFAIVGCSGCQSLGPNRIAHDRIDYGSAMAD
jgi:hypothetical protein